MAQVASKVFVIVVLVVVVAIGVGAFDREQLAKLNSMSPDQVVAYQRTIHSHGLLHHVILYGFLIGLLVGIVEAVSWVVRWPFVVWVSKPAMSQRPPV